MTWRKSLTLSGKSILRAREPWVVRDTVRGPAQRRPLSLGSPTGVSRLRGDSSEGSETQHLRVEANRGFVGGAVMGAGGDPLSGLSPGPWEDPAPGLPCWGLRGEKYWVGVGGGFPRSRFWGKDSRAQSCVWR